MIGRLARVTAAFERAYGAVRPKRHYGPAEIDPYFGYSTEDGVVLRGRILSRKPARPVKPREKDPTHWANFKSMIALFRTRELEDIRILCEGRETQSDEEGYFNLTVPQSEQKKGWASYECQFGEHSTPAQLIALVPSTDAIYGIISDIDDTLIKTEAWSLLRNLWNSLTGNAESRLVFPDAVQLIQSLHDTVNPVFYVSSSPWNMHGFLSDVFDRAGLVRGPTFLRDLGFSKPKRAGKVHGAHKAQSIDVVLAANPDLQFILIGDTGQHDAHVYHDTIQRHQGRIRQVILRTPGPGVDRKDQHWIDKIMATGTPIFVGETYQALLKP